MLTSPGVNAKKRATTTPSVATNVSSVSSQIMRLLFPLSSHFEVNDLPQNGGTENLKERGGNQHVRTHRIGKEKADVVRIQDTHHKSHENRQCDQDARRQPALRGANTNFAINSEAVANHARQPIQNFRQVSAGLFLNQQ